MATRQELISFIRSNYKHQSTDEYGVKLVVPLSDGRTQMVFAAVTESEIQVTSPVAWQTSVGADQILDANTSMFGVVKINGAFALKHNAFIADIDESEIEYAFLVLAIHADQLEASLGLSDEF